MGFRDIVVDHITKYWAVNYNALIAYVIGHASEHITGGEQPIPDATISASGLMSATDKTRLSTDPIYLYPIACIVPISNPTEEELGELPVWQDELLNGINYIYGAFPDAVANSLMWQVELPAIFASATFTAQFRVLTESADLDTMKMVLSAIRAPSGSTFDLTPVTVTSATITNTGAHHSILSTETGAFSITGTGNSVCFKVTRDYGADTLADTVRFLSIRLTPVI